MIKGATQNYHTSWVLLIQAHMSTVFSWPCLTYLPCHLRAGSSPIAETGHLLLFSLHLPSRLSPVISEYGVSLTIRLSVFGNQLL